MSLSPDLQGFEELHTEVVPCARRDNGQDIQQLLCVFRRTGKKAVGMPVSTPAYTVIQN